MMTALELALDYLVSSSHSLVVLACRMLQAMPMILPAYLLS